MEDLDIPVYRAKKIDSDEYVIGWYSNPIVIEGKLYLSIANQDGEFRIDKSTLAIHFPDMLDSEGNPIFSSLQEDGKGGDICHCTSKYQSITNEQVARYGSHKNFLPWAIEINFENKSYKDFYDEIRVIGIQE